MADTDQTQGRTQRCMSSEWSRVFTTAVHAGLDVDNPLRAMSTPIGMATTYRFDDPDHAARVHEGFEDGHFYGRMGGPTQRALEHALAVLEGGEDAATFGSGMAAISSTLMTLLQPGDHLVAPVALYTSTAALLDGMLRGWGVGVTAVDHADPDGIAAAITAATKVIYVETPSNPTLRLTDLTAVAGIARRRGIQLVVDNTFATPVNQRPLEFGADVVVHSGTKYLGGHSDVMAGAVVGRASFIRDIRWRVAKVLGSVLAPFSAWLILRGVRTLPIRMERHNANALAVATFLSDVPGVVRVHYPGLPSHPQHALAARQMNGMGGMVAFELESATVASHVIRNVKLCSPATSLGDVATLIQHSASLTQAGLSEDARRSAGVTDGLIRLSVGIERAEDIIADLAMAIDRSHNADTHGKEKIAC